MLNSIYNIRANMVNKQLKYGQKKTLGDYQNGRSTIDGIIRILEQIQIQLR